MSIRLNGLDLFDQLHTEFDNLFGDLFFAGERSSARSFPTVNLWEDDENLYVECEIPGIKRDQL